MNDKRYQLRPFTQDDLVFLYQVYAGTRQEEMARTGWSETQVDEFLRMQFQLQHVQYQENFPRAAFDIIHVDDTAVGRLYVDRGPRDILIIDLALLPAFRRQGIGSAIFRDLIDESEKTCLPIRLHVEHENPIIPYYKRLGFSQIDDTGVYYYMERPVDSTKPAEL